MDEEPSGLESMGSQRSGHNRNDLAHTHQCPSASGWPPGLLTVRGQQVVSGSPSYLTVGC